MAQFEVVRTWTEYKVKTVCVEADSAATAIAKADDGDLFDGIRESHFLDDDPETTATEVQVNAA
jgi:hypothetical protein